MTDSQKIHDAIRAAGGMVHSDGNIFFKSAEAFAAVAIGFARAVVLDSGPSSRLMKSRWLRCLRNTVRFAKNSELVKRQFKRKQRVRFKFANQRNGIEARIILSIGKTANDPGVLILANKLGQKQGRWRGELSTHERSFGSPPIYRLQASNARKSIRHQSQNLVKNGAALLHCTPYSSDVSVFFGLGHTMTVATLTKFQTVAPWYAMDSYGLQVGAMPSMVFPDGPNLTPEQIQAERAKLKQARGPCARSTPSARRRGRANLQEVQDHDG